jgi:hypothetical protein
VGDKRVNRQVWNLIQSQVRNQVEKRVFLQTERKVWDQIAGQIRNQVWFQGQIRNQVWDQIREEVRGR